MAGSGAIRVLERKPEKPGLSPEVRVGATANEEERRIPGLVHEAGPVWMGEQGKSVVGPDFRPWGVNNVYVTGGGLFPTSGSWNPTLTMCGLAQHLADTLTTA